MMLKTWRFQGWTLLLWAAMAALLFLGVREAPLEQIAAVLMRLQAGEIIALVLVNIGILFLMNIRWWLLLGAFGYKISLLALLGYRLAAFGVSYFTPGPQFGGEPLQVHLLHQNQRVPLPTAISAVYLDRLLDLLANFTFLVIGCLVILLSNLGGGLFGRWVWVPALGLLSLPLLHLFALWEGKQPAAWLLNRLTQRFPWPFLAKAREIACQSERQIVEFVREKPGSFARAVALSFIVWVAFVFEFSLSLRIIGIAAGFEETIGALTAARLAYLLPFPGGLGALEASQAIAARMLGWSPASAIALTLVIRARDVILGLLGLWFAGAAYRAILFSRFFVRERRS